MVRISGGTRRANGPAARWAASIAAALFLGVVPSAAAAKASPAKRNLALVQRMQAANVRDDCKTVIALGVPLVDGKGATGLADEYLVYVHDIVARCEIRADATEAAYRHALKGTALEGSSDFLWRLRLVIEVEEKKHEAAVATIEAMNQGRGAELNAVPMEVMWALDGDLEREAKTDLRRRLLAVLGGNSYAPEESYGPAGRFQYDHAVMLAEAGKTDEARAIVARLDTPSSLASASLDSRLRDFLPGDPDLRAATERSLARHKAAIARHPDRLEPLLLAAGDLRRLGRTAEALQLLEPAAGRIGVPEAFTDQAKQLNWWWNEVGNLHLQLGHHDEAVDAFRKGAQIVEDGALNVSQVINLAEIHNSYGHGEEALKTLAVFEASERPLSPYGHMALRYNRACAHAVARRPADAAADLAYVRAHPKDSPGMLGNLLLCLGDMDGAAAEFIKRLEGADTRTAALIELSDYDDPPVAVPLDPAEARFPALKARADIKAAIARAGGIRRFRIQPGRL